MKFMPYTSLGSMPNLIVDGPSQEATVLNLSHWPQSGTPRELKDDLSAQIVFHYLDRPEMKVAAQVVSNDHFDEDGLVSLHSIINPEHALNHRELLIDIAAGGDFGTYRYRAAARAVFVISAYADKLISPLEKSIFDKPYPDMAATLYEELLPRLPEFVADIDKHRQWWHDEDAFLDLSEEKVRSGKIKIEEVAALDLAIVSIPNVDSRNPVHRFTQSRSAWCHPMAINNATNCFRILMIHGNQYELYFRYESWLQYISRRPLPRVDLGPLAERLNAQEDGGLWTFDGVGKITPSLQLTKADESLISAESFRKQVMKFLEEAPAAWDPYD